jgi:hypothetical protein
MCDWRNRMETEDNAVIEYKRKSIGGGTGDWSAVSMFIKGPNKLNLKSYAGFCKVKSSIILMRTVSKTRLGAEA